MGRDNVLNEPRETELMRLANDNAGFEWLRGYGDGHEGRDVNPGERYVTEYLRGFIAGLQALRSA